MSDYRNNDSWKHEVMDAAVRFINTVVALLPLAVGVIVVGVLFKELFSGPFAFSCKSVPVAPMALPLKRHPFKAPRFSPRVETPDVIAPTKVERPADDADSD